MFRNWMDQQILELLLTFLYLNPARFYFQILCACMLNSFKAFKIHMPTTMSLPLKDKEDMLKRLKISSSVTLAGGGEPLHLLT